MMMKVLLAASVLCFVGAVQAKIPAPVLSDEAKAKAEEAKAKTAHNGKVDAYKLCVAQDKSATRYYADMKRANKETKPATATTPCADPGAFVYVPAAPASAPAAATAATTVTSPPAAAAPMSAPTNAPTNAPTSAPKKL
jgi:hypothetical protein